MNAEQMAELGQVALRWQERLAVAGADEAAQLRCLADRTGLSYHSILQLGRVDLAVTAARHGWQPD